MERKDKRKKIIKNILFFLLLFLLIFINMASRWAVANFGEISVEEIIFQLFSPIVTTATGTITNFIKEVLLISIIDTFIIFFVIKVVFKVIRDKDLLIGFTLRKSHVIRLPYLLMNYSIKIIVITLFAISSYTAIERFGVFDYARELVLSSTFIEENYVDPKSVKITPPENKRNLIFIYVESLEATFFSKDLGGGFDTNYLSSLTDLAKENTNFSNTEKFGGAFHLDKTGYTAAGIISQTSGIPTKLSTSAVYSNFIEDFLPGDYSLGEILKRDGYNQMFMMGSYKEYGNRGQYLDEHGNIKVYDYQTAINKGKIDEDYYEWWGFEDAKLFTYAKEEITKLAKKKKPFSFSLLTADTHAYDGYVEPYCPLKYDDQLSSVISCNANDIANFVYWIQDQDFYENTTIIISGDHHHMNQAYFKDLDEGYERTIFNLFINSAVEEKNNKNRIFCTMDIFPTTLASLGYTIEGDRLALGTNLYSGKKTIMEKYSPRKVNEEFNKRSAFYNKKIINGE